MKKKLIIPIGIILLFVLATGSYFFLFSKKLQPQKQETQPQVSQDVVPTIAPSDLGLEFTARSDKKAVKFTINKPDDITGVEYTISYTAKSKDGQDVPQGLIG